MEVKTEEEYEYIQTNMKVKEKTKKVTKQEFVNFISSYPRHLERDVCGICDPPVISYNDFEIGWWPLSVVAHTYLYDDNPKDYFYEPEDKRIYSIVINCEELYKEAQSLLKEYREKNFL